MIIVDDVVMTLQNQAGAYLLEEREAGHKPIII